MGVERVTTGVRRNTKPRKSSKDLTLFQPIGNTIHVEPYVRSLERDEELSALVRVQELNGVRLLTFPPSALEAISQRAFHKISHFFRASQLKAISDIATSSKSSNERYVASMLLRNAVTASKGILPSCQDTGTINIIGTSGSRFWLTGEPCSVCRSDICSVSEHLAVGANTAYLKGNLRYSIVAPTSMFEEKPTGGNIPANVELDSDSSCSLRFLAVAKGGGSANKTQLLQATPSILNPQAFADFILPHIKKLGTAACPPYHIGIAVGGLSPDVTLKTAILAATRSLDTLPISMDEPQGIFRDWDWEANILKASADMQYGAQFGGTNFAHSVRVIRMARHSASVHIGIAVSCSADRQMQVVINPDGVYMEPLEENPEKYLTPEIAALSTGSGEGSLSLDLTEPISSTLTALSACEVGQRVVLNGPLLVFRDKAHARLLKMIENGEQLPDYLHKHMVFYAGPAKTPEGYISGSLGPTTAGRMDTMAGRLMAHGISHASLAKGNRSQGFISDCETYGGFYLATVGGVGAELGVLLEESEVLMFPELGMEAIRRIRVRDFPAFLAVDDKGNDLYSS